MVEPEFAQSHLGSYLLNMFVERRSRLSGEAIARSFVAGNSTDTTERLPEMKVPTVVINGEFDHSRAAGELTANLTPGAVHRLVPGTGHAEPAASKIHRISTR